MTPEENTAIKVARVTVIAVFADGTSSITDFREPASFDSEMYDPPVDVEYAPGRYTFTTPDTEFVVRIKPSKKKDSIVVVRSPIPS